MKHTPLSEGGEGPGQAPITVTYESGQSRSEVTRVKAECSRQYDYKMKMARNMSQNEYFKREKTKTERTKPGALVIDIAKPRTENRDPKQRRPCAISWKSNGAVGSLKVTR